MFSAGHFRKYHNTHCLSLQILQKHCFQSLLGQKQCLCKIWRDIQSIIVFSKAALLLFNDMEINEPVLYSLAIGRSNFMILFYSKLYKGKLSFFLLDLSLE